MVNGQYNGKEYKKYQSRKWLLVLLVIILSTLAAFAPPLISLWIFKAKSALFLLSGTEWVSVITLVVSAYFGANVLQKKFEQSANITLSAGVSVGTGTETNVDTANSGSGSSVDSNVVGDSKVSVVKANENGEA